MKVIPETHWHTKFDIYVFIAIRIISKLSPLGPTGTRDAILSSPDNLISFFSHLNKIYLTVSVRSRVVVAKSLHVSL